MANRDVQVDTLIINELTKNEFLAAEKSDTELYFVTDENIVISDVEGLSETLGSLDDQTRQFQGLITGSASSESTILNQIKEMKHSTFDLSKFEVVGSPTITDDGIASGFSSNDYLTSKTTFGTFNEKLRVSCTFKLNDLSSSGQAQAIYSIRSLGSTTDVDLLSVPLFPAGTSRLDIYGGQDGHALNFYLCELDKTYRYEEEFTPTERKIYLYDDNNNLLNSKTLQITGTAQLPNLMCFIGCQKAQTQWMHGGQIDLKQFSITVDGVEVFNGNKTGIDIIKPDDYEKVNNPVISEDGILTGEVNKQVRVPVTFDATKAYRVSFDVTFGGAITEVGGHYSTAFHNLIQVYNIGPSIYFYYAKTDGNARFPIGITKEPNTTYNIFYEFNRSALTCTIGYKKSTDTEYAVQTFTMENPITPPAQSYIVFGPNLIGTLDLNTCKVYENSNLTHQLMLRIPYTQSKTGSKIVDAIYRDRVQDMYEQFGYAPYYTLGENDFTLPMGELYGMLERKTDLTVASGAGMPSHRYIDLTLGASGTKYTAPANGYINFKLHSTNSNNLSVSLARTDGFYVAGSSDQTGAMYGLVLPVTKGNSFVIGYSQSAIEVEHFRFYYAEGSK